MCFEMAIIHSFWEKEACDISFLDDREKSATEIVEILYGIVAKCLIGNTPLISSSRHQKCCCLKRSLIGISMYESARIGVNTEEESSSSIRRDIPRELSRYIGDDDGR